MSTEDRPPRRPRALRPRVPELDALLREVDELRLTLETDLSLAASAVEAGEPGLAAQILEGDSVALHHFEDAALDQLHELQGAPRRRRALVHAAPILVAAALVGVLAGALPRALGPQAPVPENVAVSDSLARIQDLAQHGTPSQVRAASQALHDQLEGVVAQATNDPAAAQTALLLLSYEQSAIVNSGDSVVLADVLRQSRALAKAILAALPPSRRVVSATPDVAVIPVASASPSPKTSPSPTAKPSAGPKADPTSSPTASPSPSKDDVPIPSPPMAP